MSDADKRQLRERLNEGLLLAHERMLREKALHGWVVIYGDEGGNPVEMPANKALNEFVERYGTRIPHHSEAMTAYCID